MDYVVKWSIEVEADSPEAAAREALEIQRDITSIATVFDVEWTKRLDSCCSITAHETVDLLKIDFPPEAV